MQNLIIDIGNTAVKAAWAEGPTIGKTFRYQGERVRNFILSLTEKEKPSVMIISSVNEISAHDEAAETLNKVIKDSSSDASAVKEATAALKALSNAIKLEGDIEALIKAKTGGDCVVIINNNSAEVIVAKGALNDTVILQIKEIVLKQTGFSAENITIVELSS